MTSGTPTVFGSLCGRCRVINELRDALVPSLRLFHCYALDRLWPHPVDGWSRLIATAIVTRFCFGDFILFWSEFRS